MSRHGTLLPIPDDQEIRNLLNFWPEYERDFHGPYPRSAWLRQFEHRLAWYYPESRSVDRTLTARHYAPFPLALGPDVP